MNTKSLRILNVLTVAAMLMLAATAGRAQSTFSNAVMALNPVAYWPLQETTPAPRYNMETNIGALGPIGNMYYYTSLSYLTNFGAFNDGADCQFFPGSSGNKGGLVPTTDNRVGMPFTQSFTVEGWYRITGTGGYGGIINETAGQGSGGINDTTNSGGWEIAQNFTPYRQGTPNSPSVFAFHVFNGFGGTGGADVEVTNAAAGEWLNGANTGYQNSWIYLACVFDGTNAWMYMFSTNLNTTSSGPYGAGYGGTNGTVYQIPIASPGDGTIAGNGTGYFAPPPYSVTNSSFVADYWDPILLGQTRSYSGNGNFGGYVQDVAIYTNALSFLQISNHFNAGTNGLGNYQTTISADNPFMHWRMNAPIWTNNFEAGNTFPVANNYGSAAATFVNNTYGTAPLTGTAAAVYQPGTLPGYAGGLAGSGFGPFTNGCAFNGLEGVVDVGVSPAINPTDVTNNYSLLLWFKGNPMDALNARFQCPASHGNLSWKAQFHNGTTYASTWGAGSSAQIAPVGNYTTYYPNDDQWHMYTFVANYNNGVSTNFSVYLDNCAHFTTLNYNVGVAGSNTMDAFIGGDPDPQYMSPTNFLTFTSGEQEFAGQVAHVAFFPTNLTVSQIQTLYYDAQPGPAVVITQPISAAVNQGSAFTNTVVAGGGAPYLYQWYTNGVALVHATNASLIINPVEPYNASTNYYVVITNLYGVVTSASASLTVFSVPSVTTGNPVTYTNLYTLYQGASPTYSVSATGALPLRYQWFTNGAPMGGATNATYTFTNVQGPFFTNYCVVTNVAGVATSSVWTAQVLADPTNSTGGLAAYPQQVLALNPIAYWRMNDASLDAVDDGNGDNGYYCHDYAGGNDGIYTNVYFLGGSGYNFVSDPSDSSAEFAGANSDAGSILAPDLATSTGSNAEFTVVAWANPVQSMNGINTPTIVAKGGYNQEEFALDAGASANSFRFEVRNAAGTVYNANSTFSVNNSASENQWYQLVGVCDEANGLVSLYINGQLAATVAIPSASGITNSSQTPLTIGSRSSTDSTINNNEPWVGFINDVAIYNRALSSGQAASLFNNSDFPPYYTQQPIGNTNANYGGVLIVPAAANGSPTLSYQWKDGGGAIAGQTNATLVVSNITVSDNYYLTVSNPYGSTNSTTVSVNVVSGMPQISGGPQNPFYATAGTTTSNSVSVYGTVPLAYQWQYSNSVAWVNVSGYRYSGTQSNTLTISDTYPSDAGFYQLVITNVVGATTSSPAQLIVSGVPLTLGNGQNWTENQNASFANGVLTLTTTGDGSTSYFYQIPQYVGGFEASFTYQAQALTTFPLADGITFCLQDDPRGASAIGLGGGDLAYIGNNGGNLLAAGNTITPSVALELNIYPGNGVGGAGYSFDANGGLGPTIAPGSVILTNGPVDVSMLYANGQLALTLSNELTAATYSTTMNVGSIPQILGANTALVGFTGSFGGDTSVQTITNFSFVSIPPETIKQVGTNVQITWPGSIFGYQLQENSSVTTNGWMNVTNQDILTNNLNQVIVPQTGRDQFYRLIFQQ